MEVAELLQRISVIFFSIMVLAHAIDSDTAKCNNLEIPFCQGVLPYNRVSYPNLLGHANQKEAWKDMLRFGKILTAEGTRCPATLTQFMCLLYAPQCTVIEGALPPCRGLCEKAKRMCFKTFAKRKTAWPQNWDCEAFPKEGLCEDGMGAMPGRLIRPPCGPFSYSGNPSFSLVYMPYMILL